MFDVVLITYWIADECCVSPVAVWVLCFVTFGYLPAGDWFGWNLLALAFACFRCVVGCIGCVW